jgi:hypothetical protein
MPAAMQLAKIEPLLAMSHSGELKPRMLMIVNLSQPRWMRVLANLQQSL